MKQKLRHITLFATVLNFLSKCAASKGQNIVVSYSYNIHYRENLQLAEDSRSILATASTIFDY